MSIKNHFFPENVIFLQRKHGMEIWFFFVVKNHAMETYYSKKGFLNQDTPTIRSKCIYSRMKLGCLN